MDIVPIAPEHVEQLRAIYRSQVAHVPHCPFMPGIDTFRDNVLMLAPRFRAEGQHFDVLVAQRDEVAEGFVALVSYVDEDDEEPRQAITGLFTATDAAAHALIKACEDRASADRLIAFPATHGNTIVETYNVGWDALSGYVPRIAGVLAQRGYTPFARELSMIARLPASAGAEWTLPLALDGPKQSISFPWSQIVRAMEGDERVGMCSFSDLSPVSDAPEANHTGYIWGLDVAEEYRRRGVARALTLAAMKQLHDQGCTTCWLTTTADNWAAQSLYYALGFEVVDCSVSFHKNLGSPRT